MAVNQVKRGDTEQAVFTQLLENNAARDVSSADILILWSGFDSQTRDVLFWKRNVTAQSKANGTPDQGIVGHPIFAGHSLPGPRTAPTTTSAGNSVARVTAAAGPTGTVRQRVYATKANTPGGTLYLIAEGADGWLAAGVALPGLADLDMVSPEPTADESATNGDLVGLGTPAAITGAAEAGAGLFTDGDHEFALVNVAASDTASTRRILFETIAFNRVTLLESTWPQGGYDELLVNEDVTP